MTTWKDPELQAALDEREPRDWSIWMEGYAATGESDTARHVADVAAPTFEEACARHFAGDRNYDPGRNTHWGCRLFNNEAAAREAFG